MGIKVTNHFADRMEMRCINMDHVKLALKNPDLQVPTYDGKIKVTKKLEDGRVLTVIYRMEGFKDANDYVLVTAYY